MLFVWSEAFYLWTVLYVSFHFMCIFPLQRCFTSESFVQAWDRTEIVGCDVRGVGDGVNAKRTRGMKDLSCLSVLIVLGFCVSAVLCWANLRGDPTIGAVMPR